MMWFWYIICCSRAGKGRAAMPVAPEAIAAAVALEAGTILLLRLLPLLAWGTGRDRVLAAARDSSHKSGASPPPGWMRAPWPGVIGVLGTVRGPERAGEAKGEASMS